MNKNTLLGLLGSLAIVVIAAGAWYYYVKTTSPHAYTTIDALYQNLSKTNKDFVNADALKVTHDYNGAIQSYQKALAKAQDPAQRDLINLSLTLAISRVNIIDAIQRYKQIIADTNVPNEIRAYALKYMAERLIATGWEESYTKEVFKDQPYASMYVPGDRLLSLRNLFDYADSLYPFAVGEFYSANWYANHILELQKTASTSPEITAALAHIEEQMKAGNADLAKDKQWGPAGAAIQTLALLRKSILLGTLSFAGFRTPEEVEAAYKDTFNYYYSHSMEETDGVLRYMYARFLAHAYGSKRASDIQNLLRPVYTDTNNQYANYSTLRILLKNDRVLIKSTSEPDIQVIKDIRLMGRLDPKFQEYLISLGWQKDDFK